VWIAQLQLVLIFLSIFVPGMKQYDKILKDLELSQKTQHWKKAGAIA
jgi:hypothetical protein